MEGQPMTDKIQKVRTYFYAPANSTNAQVREAAIEKFRVIIQ